MQDFLYTASCWIIPVLLGIIIHEVAHGYVAFKLGDYTAKMQGRLTLNPKDHIDILGTIVVPIILLLSNTGVLFGWAKPVPVDSRNFRKIKRDIGLVAFAGPFSNFLLAFIAALLIKLIILTLPETPMYFWVLNNLKNIFYFNLLLCAFNLLPVLPLDGGRIWVSVLPLKYSLIYQQTEKYGFWVLLGLLFVLPLIGIDIVNWFIGTLIPFFANLIYVFI